MTRGVGVTLGAEEGPFMGESGDVREWEEGREKGLNLAMRFLAEPRNDVGEEWEGEASGGRFGTSCWGKRGKGAQWKDDRQEGRGPVGGWIPASPGTTEVGAGIGVGGRDSATPLRCAPNDMWGGGSGMGPRPPSSRGQDLDARTTGGGAGRAVREQAPTRWLSDGSQGWVPAPRLHGGRISTRGQRGERDGRFANKPLRVVCQPGGRDGFPPPVFTGAGSRREDNGGRGVRVGGWG